jgi:hypothetical protein
MRLAIHDARQHVQSSCVDRFLRLGHVVLVRQHRHFAVLDAHRHTIAAGAQHQRSILDDQIEGLCKNTSGKMALFAASVFGRSLTARASGHILFPVSDTIAERKFATKL